jgi:AcrR family transcriptional regulator
MKLTLRDLYTHVQNEDRNPVDLTTRQRIALTRILTLAPSLMAKFGTPLLTFSAVAAALRMAPATVRFHFPDLDALLSTLLTRHLDALLAAVSEIPNEHPNRDQNRRAAYLTVTRTPSGALTQAHHLLVRDRHFLPEDALTPIEAYRHQIGTLLAGDHAEFALGILDIPHATVDQIENALRNLRPAQPPAASPQPAPNPRPVQAPAAPRLPAKGDFIPNVAYVPPPGFFEELARERAERPGPATGPP